LCDHIEVQIAAKLHLDIRHRSSKALIHAATSLGRARRIEHLIHDHKDSSGTGTKPHRVNAPSLRQLRPFSLAVLIIPRRSSSPRLTWQKLCAVKAKSLIRCRRAKAAPLFLDLYWPALHRRNLRCCTRSPTLTEHENSTIRRSL
jgi:hypothetical protein